MSHSIVDVDDIPYVWGTFKFVRHHLGVTGVRDQRRSTSRRTRSAREHDEATSGQEEVYLTLAGGGTLEIEGETSR